MHTHMHTHTHKKHIRTYRAAEKCHRRAGDERRVKQSTASPEPSVARVECTQSSGNVAAESAPSRRPSCNFTQGLSKKRSQSSRRVANGLIDEFDVCESARSSCFEGCLKFIAVDPAPKAEGPQAGCRRIPLCRCGDIPSCGAQLNQHRSGRFLPHH